MLQPLFLLLLLAVPGDAASVAPGPQTVREEARQRSSPAAGAATAESQTNPIDYATVRLERVVHAKCIEERIEIDGRLDEPAWATAVPASDFTQWEPNPGMPATDRTEARFLYDANNLYVGIRAFDREPHRLIINQLRKDFDVQEGDTVGIFIDSLHDRQSGFIFQTNPAGARRDNQISHDGDQSNLDWDGVWDVKTTIDDQGWTAEFIFSLKTLRFSSAPQQEWGLNLLRRVRRSNEDSHWSPLPRRYRLQRASFAGTLAGLEGIRQGRNLKIKPYAIGSVLTSGGAARRIDGNGGADLKYGITPSMTLDLTYRTDFSQVEADQQQVNLTRFNLLFPEKREFFLENAGNFAMAAGAGAGAQNVVPFFSRRIGLSSDGTPIPIVVGARVSGRSGSYDVGLISMRTEREGAVPANNFLAGRLRKTLWNASTLGAIVTSRDSTVAGDYSRLYGVDTLLRLLDRRLEVSSYLLRTESPGRNGRDLARLVGAAWLDNDLTIRGQHEQVQANFNPEVGFVRRPSATHNSGSISWRPRPRSNSRVRNYDLDIRSDYYADDDGRLATREHRAGAGIAFQDSSVLGLTVVRTFDRLLSPFAIRPAVVIAAGDYAYQRYSVSFNTDRSRILSANFTASAGDFWDGGNRSVGGTVEFKPNYHLNVDVNFSYSRVDLPAGRFTTPLIGTRVVWGFTAKAFINSFLQYNATTRQFSTNTRFNIIHRPLSDLYVVYNERRDTVSQRLLDRGLTVKFTNMFDF